MSEHIIGTNGFRLSASLPLINEEVGHDESNADEYFEWEDDVELEINDQEFPRDLKCEISSDTNLKDFNESKEEDPLELYMKTIEKMAKRDLESVGKQENFQKGIRVDIEFEDDQETLFKWLSEHPNADVIETEEYNDDELNFEVEPQSQLTTLEPFLNSSSAIRFKSFERFDPRLEEFDELSNGEIDELQKSLNAKL